MSAGEYDLVAVANRLPVDFTVDKSGELSWTRSPGGLVTALEPMMQAADGAWVGWSGAPDLAHDPFDADGMRLVPVTLSAEEITLYYEGFANDTLWPLYHDVITAPAYHRQWWDAYRRVNRRFAEAAAAQVAPGGTVWVHDYQLQLVPAMLRELRPDIRIGFFNHIPFPGLEIFAQLPWRRQIVEGLLGADVIGFQRTSDAANFVRAVRRLTDLTTRGQVITVTGADGRVERHVRAAAFPISIDSHHFDQLARSPEVQQRAREIREELGNPGILLLGVDRLDYTKGIRHRVKAFGELVEDGRLTVPEATLVQVASPSRENVGAYQQLREDVELLVGRINGDFGHLGHPAVHYLHHSYPPEEMAALYLAADVMLVTALRDGMNLVAKEYVAARSDDRGVLVLSEFTGAADELTGAVMVNPHDIDGMKDKIVQAVEMDPREQRKRMRRLRRRVLEDDVAKWSRSFLSVLGAVPLADAAGDPGSDADPRGGEARHEEFADDVAPGELAR
ncbi:trehalose-6-phosphate synthase [Cellulomonas sp. ATA003]|uniref:alpha,alpha-trehalose-phosphate synthase (UDP-forming) n=1 Tax=Cellulomonas sp. ATA003 TaxID=3073064 RepID=UPI002873890A|nr:trehalose-6-phosphate synthase [Cellulomonas sp. ATA003]WNB85283.1 trehalose-6-phosphate synthase [Cellulomonas sp. ATA003]